MHTQGSPFVQLARHTGVSVYTYIYTQSSRVQPGDTVANLQALRELLVCPSHK